MPIKFLKEELDLGEHSFGHTEEEILYRQWCLGNTLFLNPLNDIIKHSICARDVFTTPSMRGPINEGPVLPSFFNQIKQEFVSARYLFYQGINSDHPHFSDSEVRIYNSLDYPSYSLAVEKIKLAFRSAYSLFDKISYFLNHYLGLSIPERRVSFRTMWYNSQKRDEKLITEFQDCKNLPLRGLFWLSKDLFENEDGFRESIEPDAQKINYIRNHLEHKYFKLHENYWHGPNSDDIASRYMEDTLAYSMYRREFTKKTLRIIKMARAALIYLSTAIHFQELNRVEDGDDKKIFLDSPLYVLDWESRY